MRTAALPLADTSPGLVRDLIALTKPRINALVLVTADGGLWLAPGPLDPVVAVVTLVALALVVGSANALNCYLERDSDALMHRTKDRPLAARRVEPRVALVFALAIALLALPVLTFVINPLTGALSAVALVSYVWIYTPMKKRSTDALLVGAIPGAMPPLIGWTAATGRIELPGVVLFTILFVWQLPHFLAIALYLKEDYARGGLKVFPVVRGERSALRWTIFWSVMQLAVSLLLLPLGLAGPLYGVSATIAGLAYLAFAVTGLWAKTGKRWARKLMLASIVYLLVLFLALALSAV